MNDDEPQTEGDLSLLTFDDGMAAANLWWGDGSFDRPLVHLTLTNSDTTPPNGAKIALTQDEARELGELLIGLSAENQP